MADMSESDQERDDIEDQETVSDDLPAVRRCWHCKATVSSDAETCPKCGKDLTQPRGARWFAWVVLIVLALLLAVGIYALVQ